MMQIMDEWFDNKLKSLRDQRTSRTGGRASLPQIISDMFFGPPKD